MAEHKDVLISIRDLTKRFAAPGRKKAVRAVDGVSLDIYRGEALGLVGESGCGKTTLGRCILRLIEPSGGRIEYDGQVLFDKEEGIRAEMLPFRRKMQIIFQNPAASLDPRTTVGESIGEALDIHRLVKGREERQQRIEALMTEVGLDPADAGRYPGAFSGGQQQRVGIARALAVEPEFIVCDEPISSLDVSIQSQIINTLEDLKQQKGLTYLFIAHDLSVVRHISDRIGVMYLGRLVELGDSVSLTARPLHPYTRALLSAVPLPDPEKNRLRERNPMQGEPPSPVDPPSGCAFHPRCPMATEKCRQETPPLMEREPGRFAACHMLSLPKEGRDSAT